MFRVENRAVGAYISGLIDSKYESAREFCRRWLKLTGEEINEDTIRNKANKLSQIKSGSKGIQTYDLPAFSELLGISFEQILSAGQSGKPKEIRATNYTIAQSNNADEWEEYINREDKPILCKDEFGINTLEYAIEFGNYDFIRFLMDKNYIWFDSRKDKDYIMTFGAGTSIQKINFEDRGNGIYIRKPDMDDLQYMLATEDQLRYHIIAMAADHNDLKMLEKLRAREIPELYYKAHYLSCSHPDFNANYDAKTVKHISQCDNTVLNYFTDSFDVRDEVRYKDGSKRKHTFIYPYISNLLDLMIVNNHPFTNTALEKMIAYNERVYKQLTELINNVCENNHYFGDGWKEEFDFYSNGNIVSFRDPFAVKGIITNIAIATKKSLNPETNSLIERLKKSYDTIRMLGENMQ